MLFVSKSSSHQFQYVGEVFPKYQAILWHQLIVLQFNLIELTVSTKR